MITPTVSHQKTLAMFRRAAAGRAAATFDATAGLATIAVMGPASRELLGRISPADLSNAALPWGRAAEIEVGDGYALCLRVSFVGELGYELYPSADLAVSLYDAVRRRRRGPRPAARRLPRARLAPGGEGLPAPRPRHRPGRRPVPGRSRVHRRARQARRLHRPRRDRGARGRDARTAARCSSGSHDPEPLLLHGESLLLGGEIVGRMTSGAYGHTLGAACGLGYLRGDVPAGDALRGRLRRARRVAATVSDTPFYDPGNERLRG